MSAARSLDPTKIFVDAPPVFLLIWQMSGSFHSTSIHILFDFQKFRSTSRWKWNGSRMKVEWKFWKLNGSRMGARWKLMEVVGSGLEVNRNFHALRWKFPLWKLVEAKGSFHGHARWKLGRASTNLPYTLA